MTLEQYLKSIGRSLNDDGSFDGYLDLTGAAITSLPDNLSVGGSLYPRGTAITSIPDNLSVGGYLYTEGTVTINGRPVQIKIIDYLPTIIGKWRKRGDVQYCKAYICHTFSASNPVFRKENEQYIAKGEKYYAHGDTLEEAQDSLLLAEAQS